MKNIILNIHIQLNDIYKTIKKFIVDPKEFQFNENDDEDK